MADFFVGSEVSRLKHVLLHQPDLAFHRITHKNCHDLLFDDVLWSEKAKQEHKVFVDILCENQIEVFIFREFIS